MGNKGISFFLIKKDGHTSFQLMIVLISKALIQKEKKNQSHQRLPLLSLYFFFVLFSIFLLSYFLPRPPFWVFSLAYFSSFFPFLCVQRLTSILIHFKVHALYDDPPWNTKKIFIGERWWEMGWERKWILAIPCT